MMFYPLKRCSVFIKRFIKSQKMNISFSGTSRFNIPSVFWINGKKNHLCYPAENDLKYDFINIIIDDEYGINRLNSISSIVDIGANIGLFSLLASNYFPKATIHAYEPNPKITKYLKDNLDKINGEIYTKAVGLNSQKVFLKKESESRMSSILQNKIVDSIPVDQISLSDVLKNIGGQIDLLKLDCEGGEWEILDDKISFKRVSHLRMEYHLIGQYTLQNLLVKASDLGFNPVKIVKNSNFGIAWFSKKI